MHSVKSNPLTSAERILILGVSSSGKTTLARRLSASLNVPHHELDTLFWRSRGESLSLADFRARVGDLCAQPRWIIEGHDAKVGDLTWPRAEVIIWLDLGFSTVVARAIRRSLTLASLLSHKSNLLSTLRTFHARRRQYSHAGVPILRITQAAQAERLLSDAR